MQKRINKKFIIPLVLGIVVLIVGVLLVLVVFPKVIDDQVIENVVLKPDTVQLERFRKIPFPFKFSVYLYTILNKEEVLNEGKKPKVKQIGPYVYDEYKERRILKEGAEELKYEEVWSFEFNQTASGSLKEDDEVTVINAPLVTILQSVESASLPMPPSTIEAAIKDILDNTELFMTVRVGDLTFKGIKMCHKKDASSTAKLLCLTISLMNQKMLEYHEDYTLFSLFKYKTKADGPFVLNTGATDSKKLGLITSYKGMENTEFWNGTNSACDKVNGYFTTFPPFMEQNTSYNVYSSDLCKSASLSYVKDGTYQNLSSYEFKMHKDSFVAPEEQSCVCIDATRGLDGSSHCFKKAVLDMNRCLGVPVIVSFPHLMWADEAYRNSIEDELYSENDSYNTLVDFEPRLGIPLRGAIRLQFNVITRPITSNNGEVLPMTEKWPRTMFPIFWLEDSFQLTNELVEEIDSKLIGPLALADAVQWSVVGVGAALTVLSIVLLIACRRSEKLDLQ